MSPEKFDDKLDKKIKEALYKGTYRPTNAMLDKNREQILTRIEEIEKKQLAGKRFRWRKTLGIVSAAMVMIFALSLMTQPGQAALEKIRQYFEPEKIVEHEVEGDKENIKGRLQQSEIGYAIYYDQDRYKVVEDKEVKRFEMSEEGDGVPEIREVDRIVMKEELAGFPEVYMEIYRDQLYNSEELASMFEMELKEEFSNVNPAVKVNEPIEEAIYIHAIDGGKSGDDPIVDYYLVDSERGTFVIKLKYFLEAAEGHGARFRNMLRDFTILDTE